MFLLLLLLFVVFIILIGATSLGLLWDVRIQLNPNHRTNRFHGMGLELLYALRTAQWRSRDLGGWRRRQKQHHRLQKEQYRHHLSSAGFFSATSLQLTRDAHQQAEKQHQQGEGGGPPGPHPLGGFQDPRLVYVEELGADVLAADVDIGESAALWRRHYYVPNGLKLVVLGPATPQDLMKLVQQTFGLLAANPKLKPFDCRDKRSSDVEALNPQPPQFAAQWPGAGKTTDATSSERRERRSSKGASNATAGRDVGGPPACPNPKLFTEAGGEENASSAAASLGCEPVARLRDLSRMVLMLPATRQSHIMEFVFIFENEGNRRPPCKDLK